jgi:hypothetical protein
MRFQSIILYLFCLISLAGCIGEKVEMELGPKGPTALVVSPVSPSSDTTPTVSGTTSASVSVILYSGANCSSSNLASATSDASGAFSITSSVLATGTYALSVKAFNSSGSTCSAASLEYAVDTSVPGVTISAPSASLVNSVSPAVDYTVTYTDATTINLTDTEVTLNTTGTATCPTKTVTNGTTATPTINLSGCTGDGTVGVSIGAGTAVNASGSEALAAGPSATFTVDNTGISSATFDPLTGTFSAIPASVTITFPETTTGTSITTADFSVTGTCSVLPTLSVDSTTATTAAISLAGETCGVGETTVVTLDLTGVNDAAGNAGSGTVAETYTFDNVGPTSATFSPVTGSVSSIPGSVDVTFNESVMASSISDGDFVVSGTCGTLPTVTVSNVSGATVTLALAGASCTLNQTSIITVSFSDILDTTGNAGSGSDSVTYTFDNVGPVASTISPTTSTVASIPTSVDVTFDENLLSSSVAAGDIVVSGTCATLPTVSLTSVVTTTATFGLMGSSCSLGETVVVTMDGSSITDAAGNAGTGSVSATYTFDNVGPVAQSVTPATSAVNAIPTSLTVSFDEDLLSSSVSAGDLAVTGTCSTLPTASLSSVSGASAVFGLSAATCAHGETTEVTMNGSSITDATGNAGSGTASATYTVDTVGPTPSSISPVTANFATMPSSVSVTFDEDILSSSVVAGDLAISGTCTTLPTASVSSVSGGIVTFGLTGESCSDGQTVIVTASGADVTDTSGNVGSSSQTATYTKDTTGPTVSSFTPATSTVLTVPASVDVNFDETLDSASVGTADFAMTGTCSVQPTLSISSVTGNVVSVGLASATCADGETSVLNVTASGITDTAGNAGTGTPSVTYTVDSVGPTVSSFTPSTGAPPASVDVTFSENLDSSSVAVTDFTLSGTCAATLDSTTVLNNVVTLAMTATCLSGETVIIDINGSSVTDTVGNAGTGTGSVTFTEP